ncbi:MAG: beta-galactosidase, partial [Anaerolineae bacterium]|nr:beta-galactosidase [Anaerolineae bacterium]
MRRTFSLNGTWKFEPVANVLLKLDGMVENTDHLPVSGEMELPMNWQLRGLNNFHGRVRFQRSFVFDGLQAGETSLWVMFRGVDYYAKVWINDTLVGQHEGYFQTFGFDITEAVIIGENQIVVEVTDPLEEPGTVWPHHKRMIKGVISHWDCRPGSWNLETGQDQNSGGIWNDVLLETRPAAFVGHVRTSTTLVPQKAPEDLVLGFEPDPEDDTSFQAMVLVEVEVFGPKANYQVIARIGAEESPAGIAEQMIRQTQDGQRHTLVVQVPEPELWWTWDMGEPHLEPLTVILKRDGQEVDRHQIEIGMRELRLDPQTGEWWLNKQRFFVRGTNVVPTLWLGEYDQSMIARDIELLRNASINGVRVCVHVNRDEFYTALDRAGIIAWQDFALQWGYIESIEVTRDAVSQIRDMVRLLVNHPCIALWCCQNESTFHNKKILDPVLAQAVAMEDGSRYIR